MLGWACRQGWPTPEDHCLLIRHDHLARFDGLHVLPICLRFGSGASSSDETKPASSSDETKPASSSVSEMMMVFSESEMMVVSCSTLAVLCAVLFGAMADRCCSVIVAGAVVASAKALHHLPKVLCQRFIMLRAQFKVLLL